jgi:hypothetical protein
MPVACSNSFSGDRTGIRTRKAWGWTGAPRFPVLTLILLLIIGAGAMLACLGVRAFAQGSAGATFRNFNGCVRLGPPAEPPEVTQKLGTGWIRADFSWNDIEPQKGKWNWETFDNQVRRAQSEGAQVLPILDYSALWAASVKGNYLSVPNEADWDEYVEQVVARYSASPYNMRYFQVWNEPTVEAGFLKGASNLDYIDKIYLPAAKIIRKHNCYVVFGGWPHSNSLDQLGQELDHNNAWQWTDIVDVHYFEMYAWQNLYDRWIATGKCKGIWQSEIGWNNSPNFLPNTYWRILYWSLQRGWQNLDQYKVFWYQRFDTGANAVKALVTQDPSGNFELSQHGQRLAEMNQLLGNSPLQLFTQFSTNPSVAPSSEETTPTALGFRVGNDSVVIVLLLAAVPANRPVSVAVDLPRKPARVTLLSATGDSLPLRSNYTSGRLQINALTNGFSTAIATWRPAGPFNVSIGYLEIGL